jgi:putative lipoprotein
MNTLRVLFLIISAVCIFVSNGMCINVSSCFFFSNSIFCYFEDAAPISKKQPTLIIRGRVIYPGGSKIPVESGAQLTVELQDTSLADAPAKVIAKGTGKAARFPMAFAIKYLPTQVGSGVTYSLSVTIKNKKNELLYINDMHVQVKPLGDSRTKFIDVPVILVKSRQRKTVDDSLWKIIYIF